MSNIPIFERLVWFHQEARTRKYPIAGLLARRFEISSRTAQRNIEFLRDRMADPLEYDASRRGYYYTDDSFELPRFPATREEILAVLISKKLLAHSAAGSISETINKFMQKLFSTAGDPGLPMSRLDEAFSATWTGFSPADPNVFRKTTATLLAGKHLE